MKTEPQKKPPSAMHDAMSAAVSTDLELFSRPKVKELTGCKDKGHWIMYHINKVVAPIKVSHYWMYRRADVEAIRADRRVRGMTVPQVDGFE